MPWQRLVAEVGGELNTDGTPAYRSVVVTVPRQSGKTVLVLSWEVQRCLGWGGPQRVAYSAQTGNDARKKLIEDQGPILHQHRKALGIHRVRRGMGGEGVDFTNGSIISLLASSEEAGHGRTIDLGVKDELFADADDRRDQALIPAMATRPAAQILTSSTAGHERSFTLWREVEAGRKAVGEGRTDGIAYFEWSAPDDADIADPDVWWSCMPALGHTITEAVVQHALDTMSESEFRRAWLNQWVNPPMFGVAREEVIDLVAWAELINTTSTLNDSDLRLAVEVAWDRSWASIGASDGRHIEVVERRAGVQWLVDRLPGIVERNAPGRPVVCDPGGPAGAVVAELDRAGVALEPIGLTALKQACGAFVAAVEAEQVVHLGQDALTEAVAGAEVRAASDAWMFDRRRSTVDVSPLLAVVMARWAAAASPAVVSDFFTI